ncbi:hypothetical protein [Zavarzinella formosa]|uniref:hypothetical protein n=1 Tax=Zavarzinella formosa TaxID=360055 RepID=UPI00037C4314|nr:hypothetical protein [Zavarzinella formosa]
MNNSAADETYYILVREDHVLIRVRGISKTLAVSAGRFVMRPGDKLHGVTYQEIVDFGSGAVRFLAPEEAGGQPRLVRVPPMLKLPPPRPSAESPKLSRRRGGPAE